MQTQYPYPNVNDNFAASPYGTPKNQQNPTQTVPNGGTNYGNYPNSYNNTNNYSNYNNASNTYNTQNMVAATANQASFNMQHGATQRLHQGQYYQNNKDLNNTLQGNARGAFVRQVYTLLTIQLLGTILIGYWAYNNPFFKRVFVNIPMMIILSVLLIAVSCFMACAMTAFRRFAPVIFVIFTLLMALLLGISICNYKSKTILMAAGITFLLVAALTAYACITKTDLTGCGPYLMVVCLILFVFGIVCIFWRDPIVHLIYSCLAALLFSIYLIFDTQLVLGRGQFSYGLDDAFLAAIQLYTDIIQLFLHILSILGNSN